MAIIINAKDFLGVPNTNFNGPAIRQTINISIADTGKVNSDVINLGNQGDDGVKLYKTYSDIGNYIKQLPTELVYDIAIDVENAPYTYIETDEKIVDLEE